MARSITAPTATREQCARLDAFARELGLEAEDLHPPHPNQRHTSSTTIDVDQLRELDEFARARGTTPAVIQRAAIAGVLKRARSPQDGGG